MDDRSEARMTGVDVRLVAVVRRAYEILDAVDDGLSFVVTEGLRSIARQEQLVKAGASQTMKSRHLIGQAVDLAATVNGDIRWDWPLYTKLADAMKQAAKEQGVVITWGGSWTTLRDGPHFQIEPDLKAA
jgi:peptidoglycan L-alanyl-D-glutamate endopeptidase CwlK